MKSKVALIIPTLNEADNLRRLLPMLASEYRVVVVDNGSADDSISVAKEYNVEVIMHSVRGYGGAVKAGISHLQKHNSPTAVAVVDADEAQPQVHLEMMFDVMQREKCEIVFAQRTKSMDSIPLHAKLGNELVLFMVWCLTGVKFQDFGPLRIFTLKSISDLNMQDENWGWNVEMQIKVAKMAVPFCEIDVPHERRQLGTSKISGDILGSLKAGIKMIYAALRYSIF